MGFWNFSESRTFEGAAIIFISAVAAGGWIYGASDNLASVGCQADARLALLCDGGVILTGGIISLLWLAGRRLSTLAIINVLLAASFVFGVLALWIMHAHGVLAIALDPAGKYPEWLAGAVPVLLLLIMASTWYPAARRRLQRRALERSDSPAPPSPR